MPLCLLLVIFLLSCSTVGTEQDQSPRTLDIQKAVALETFPMIRAALPGNLFAPDPYPTRNNIFGLTAANGDTFNFGTGANQSHALDVSVSLVDISLTMLAADQTLAKAEVERSAVFARAINELVNKQLRPCVDASRAQAEPATARDLLIQAGQNVDPVRANFAEDLGNGGEILSNISNNPGPFARSATQQSSTINFSLQFLAIAQTAAVDSYRSRENVLAMSYFLRSNWEAVVYTC